MNVERKLESGRQVRDELGVRHGCRAANPVLDMDHAEIETKLAQRMQQEHRIRTTGHGDAHGLSGFEHAMPRDEFGYAIQHSARIIRRAGRGSKTTGNPSLEVR